MINSQQIKYASLSLLIVFFIYLAYLSVKWAIASVIEVQLRHQLGEAQSQLTTNLTIEDWQNIATQLSFAEQMHENNSELSILGMFANQVKGQKFEQQQLRDAANIAYQQSIKDAEKGLKLRPSWTALWEGLVVNKIHSGQYDNTLEAGFERIVSLGRWEYSAQYQLVYNAFLNWNKLTEFEHILVGKAFKQLYIMTLKTDILIKNLTEGVNKSIICVNDSKDLILFCEN
ncbi:hypothetical protein KEF85_11875 [Methylomonas paludis]|uniref:Uncharacterized protein n=1 Tax=Methylomonas paludis TaxID=1173101 RepID=A0A975MLE3_9GAMM|nr:hypothetical protein [Methylomonas paludis]QWF70048.1 hypothetical protein KEF85_11875 [Methylomonas paludis]